MSAPGGWSKRTAKGVVPEVGMGATVMFFSDREAGTIIDVKPYKGGPNKGQPKEIVFQYDHWKVVSGSAGDGSAVYEYERNPNGRTETFTFSKKRQRWVEAKTGGRGVWLALGVRSQHYDPHF